MLACKRVLVLTYKRGMNRLLAFRFFKVALKRREIQMALEWLFFLITLQKSPSG